MVACSMTKGIVRAVVLDGSDWADRKSCWLVTRRRTASDHCVAHPVGGLYDLPWAQGDLDEG
jgi:hypothetical protein